MPTRRAFVGLSALAVAGRVLRGRALLGQALPAAPTTRPNLRVIDRTRILAGAERALALPSEPVGHADPASEAFLAFTLAVPALAAAAIVDPVQSARYCTAAARLLTGWMVSPETRLTTSPPGTAYEPLLDRAQLAEVAVAVPFLALEPAALAAIKAWFAAYLTYLTEDRTSQLARDTRDRHASSWLLQASAFAQLTGNDRVTDECRHRFKTVTVRAQIDANGFFAHELTTENPFRNSLLNLDMLAGVCNLLSTRFENVWEHELQDGPGMRSAVARHAAYIREPVKWPYAADRTHFKLLPGRRPALVFAARAFGAADYVTLWRTLNADPTDPDILRAFPIRQPILWLPQTQAATSDAKA